MEKISRQKKQNWAIIGAGGFGREVFCVVNENINALNLNNFIGFFDDDETLERQNEFGMILGTISELCDIYNNICIFIAVASPKARFNIYQKLKQYQFEYPNLINSDFKMLHRDSFKIGKGNIILSRSSVSVNVLLGDFNILNSNISIGHDAHVGDFNTFMPATKISGNVIIGNCNSFGLNSGVLQGVKVGQNLTLGPMSVLYKNGKDDVTYFGNPAKKFEF